MKMRNYLAFCLAIVVIVACSKDKFETTPSLVYKSANTEVVPVGGILRPVLEYTDKEGDLDSVFVGRVRLNKKSPDTAATLEFIVPEFQNESKGEIMLELLYSTYLTLNFNAIPAPGTGGGNEPDTLMLHFQVKDAAGHFSDTVRKEFIVIR
jgi:hypothetical protein